MDASSRLLSMLYDRVEGFVDTARRAADADAAVLAIRGGDFKPTDEDLRLLGAAVYYALLRGVPAVVVHGRADATTDIIIQYRRHRKPKPGEEAILNIAAHRAHLCEHP
jgi:hypothetical protein